METWILNIKVFLKLRLVYTADFKVWVRNPIFQSSNLPQLDSGGKTVVEY